ncbi:MAG TPA: DsbA family protein [Candidatus Saccharibacteria bacterium]|nr:DsbA family protein [Candidatus Saccharibacteria bacterium]
MNRTAWIVIIAACVLGLGTLIFFTKKDAVNIDDIEPVSIVSSTEDSIGDRVFGKTDAKVIVFEYADFQCPGCASAFPTINKIQDLYRDKVAFVFRHFPLTTIHPNALAAATVAEAAGQQGKFWEMHDLLFRNRNDWVNLSTDQRGDIFIGYAQQLDLDTDQFTTDQASALVAQKIDRDRALGGKMNVSATPTLFIGSEKISDEILSGPSGNSDAPTGVSIINGDGTAFMDKLDAALKAAGETPPSR